jgi:hypothetical protein
VFGFKTRGIIGISLDKSSRVEMTGEVGRTDTCHASHRVGLSYLMAGQCHANASVRAIARIGTSDKGWEEQVLKGMT